MLDHQSTRRLHLEHHHIAYVPSGTVMRHISPTLRPGVGNLFCEYFVSHWMAARRARLINLLGGLARGFGSGACSDMLFVCAPAL